MHSAAQTELRVMAHGAQHDLLRHIASIVHDPMDHLRKGNRRVRAAHIAAHFDKVVAGVGGVEVLPTPFSPMTDRAVGETANPISGQIELGIVNEEVVVRTKLGPTHEDAPGRSNGGVGATPFDGFSTFVLPLAETATSNGEITVRYHRPVPIEAPREFQSRIGSHEGGNLRVAGE